MSRLWKFSRSHDQAYIDCPRYNFLQYYYNGKGIVLKKLDLYQSTGSLCHAILEMVMQQAKQLGTVPPVEVVNTICKVEKGEYRKSVEKAGLTETGSLELEMARQSALAEGLARVWTLYRLPAILEEYEILGVEEEQEIPFGPGQVLLSRPDCTLRRKVDGELFAGPEFKTTGWINDDYLESWRYSTQTLSHGLDVMHKYGKEPTGVMMEFLYKGFKKKGEDGVYTYYSPLVRAFRMKGEFGSEEYGFDSNLGRKKDWEAFDTYTMGMDKWVDMLPLEVVTDMLYSTTIYRSDRELEEWKMQTALRQARIQAAYIMLFEDKPTQEAADEIMATVFPARLDRYCYSNQYKKKCIYCDICYKKIDDPIGSGLYVEREPHHPGEWDDE